MYYTIKEEQVLFLFLFSETILQPEGLRGRMEKLLTDLLLLLPWEPEKRLHTHQFYNSIF